MVALPPPPPRWPPPAVAAPDYHPWSTTRSPAARLGFHLLGALLVAAATLVFFVVVVVLALTTAPCPPDDAGDPVTLHLGTALAGLAPLATSVLWARRARRRGQAWSPWAGVAVLSAAALVWAAVAVSAPTCPFSF